MNSFVAGFPYLRCVALLLCLGGPMLRAEDAARGFDIPAGTAEQTLKQFAAQSGVEVLYSTEAARGIRTNPVKGVLHVHEAAKRMLSGTPLYVVHDRKHGVLRIARTPDPNGQRAAPKAACARPTIQNPPDCRNPTPP